MVFRFNFKPPQYENLLKDLYIITKSFVSKLVSSCEKKRSEIYLTVEVSLFFLFLAFFNSHRLWSSAFPVFEASPSYFYFFFFGINMSLRGKMISVRFFHLVPHSPQLMSDARVLSPSITDRCGYWKMAEWEVATASSFCNTEAA